MSDDDAKIAELEQQLAQLKMKKAETKEAQLREAQLKEAKINEFLKNNQLTKEHFPTPICESNVTIWQTMYTHNVDIPNKHFEIVNTLLPAVHFCAECDKFTNHVFLTSGFPSYYYDDSEEPTQINECDGQFRCLTCLFNSGKVFTSAK